MSLTTVEMAKAMKDGAFDGIICIGGEDWWYHNRGHFDFQIMRRLAWKYPVLFINSLGVRMPSPSKDNAFASRMFRKAKSLARGAAHIENNFWVYSPVSIPGQRGEKISSWALAPQIRLMAWRAGIRKPLLWMHCPTGANLADEIDHVGMVLQRTDRFEAFPEADPERIGAQIKKLKAEADLVIYAAPHLMEEERDEVQNSLLVTHGVDYDLFVKEGDTRQRGPGDMMFMPRPRVGFVGGIDDHTFDQELFLKVVAAMPDVQFVMVGGCSLPAGWCTADNVTFLGRKPYNVIARYMAAMDVLIMPWNKSEWIQACNPIKLKEYLAVGRPVVTTDFPALAPWRDLVSVAGDADTFALKIRHALMADYLPETARERVMGESWDSKADFVLKQLLEVTSARRPGLANDAVDNTAVEYSSIEEPAVEEMTAVDDVVVAEDGIRERAKTEAA